MRLTNPSLRFNVSMEDSAGARKPWDHAWNTEEIRKNRRNWSLAGDSGLLKHLQQFSEDLIVKANETRNCIDSMTAELDRTAILVDNITNTSLALANTQFIESRVQDDNIEIEQPVEDASKKRNDHELSATDLLVSVCESIKQGLLIMDEKYEKVETVARSDEDGNTVPSIFIRPKDPYQNRPLPYVIGTEQWTLSSKVGLESSSSDSEQDDEDEDPGGVANIKIPQNIMNSNISVNSGISRLSTTSSESNDFNNDRCDLKSNYSGKSFAKSRDPLDLETDSQSPSSTMKTVHDSNGPLSFAEELAKRLGSVKTVQTGVAASDADESSSERSKDNNSLSGAQPGGVSDTKRTNLPSSGVSSGWRDKPVRPMKNNIIPPSIDVPPPLSIVSTAPKSNFDDLFGEGDNSDDSDDIFSNKSSKNVFSVERGPIKTETNEQKPLGAQNVQNVSNISTSTPQTRDREKGLFSDDEEEEDDLFKSSVRVTKPREDSAPDFDRKKPVGGVSIFGKVDILSSSKFARRDSSSSSNASEEQQQPQTSRIGSNTLESIPKIDDVRAPGANVSSSFETGNNVSNNNLAVSSATISNSSSGVSARQPSIDNTAGSSLGADFQPLMSSSRLKSDETYRERVASDSLSAAKSKTTSSSSAPPPQQQQSSQSSKEDVSGHDHLFGPPPLPKSSDSKAKSKVTSLFDDSDSDDDLFASPSSGSVRSGVGGGDRTSTTTAPSSSRPKKLNLFDDDDDDDDNGGANDRLFGARDAPGVNLFSSAPISSISRIADGLDSPSPSKRAAPAKPERNESKPSTTTTTTTTTRAPTKGLFDDLDDSDEADSDLFGSIKASKPSVSGAKVAPVATKSVLEEPAAVAASSSSAGKSAAIDPKADASGSPRDPPKSVPPTKVEPTPRLFENNNDDSEEGLFAKSASSTKEKALVGASKPIESSRVSAEQRDAPAKKLESPDPPRVDKPANTRPKASLFDDDDDDDDAEGLFSGSPSLPSTRKTAVVSESSVSKPIKTPDVRVEQKVFSVPKPESGNPPKPEQLVDTRPKASLFDDDDSEEDLFASSSASNKKKTVPGSGANVTQATESSRVPAQQGALSKHDLPTSEQPLNTKSKASLFDDDESNSEEGLFGSSVISNVKKSAVDSGTNASKPAHPEPKNSSVENPERLDPPPVEEPAVSKHKTSIFDDDNDDDGEEDLFLKSSSSSSSKKTIVGSEAHKTIDNSRNLLEQESSSGVESQSRDPPNTEAPDAKTKASIFDDDGDGKDLFGDIPKTPRAPVIKKMESEERKEDEKPVKPPANMEPVQEQEDSKPPASRSLFDDDDDDDLFGDKKKQKIAVAAAVDAEEHPQPRSEEAPKEQPKKPAVPERSAVDGAASSKRSEPPTSLRVHPVLPKLDVAAASAEAAKPDRTSPAKPAVSGKIKNLMGKMGDLKILSPTDTPPLFRKNAEDRATTAATTASTPANDGTNGDEPVCSENSSPSLPSSGSSPHTTGTNSRTRDSPSLMSENIEVAISFDEPVQVETLTSTASKTRARIQAKRRPQSRQARQSALRHSGIDFDAVDAASTSQPNGNASEADLINANQHQRSKTHHSDNLLRPNSLVHTDDKSEISASRNTTTNLLSPSTDEEDLFDVLPDLPEDPAAREDSLFVRAPILSPEPTPGHREKSRETLKDTSGTPKEVEPTVECSKRDEQEEKLDPLSDQRHDPLNDPSQLFAFVTKTPSPEKSKGLLVSEDDDSLFSSSSKAVENKPGSKSKPTLNLFSDEDDESSSDLFSSKKVKAKPLKDTKIDLFNDSALESDDDNLFGTAKKDDKASTVSDPPVAVTANKVNAKEEAKIPATAAKNILDDSSGEEDMFSSSKKPTVTKTTTSLFDESDDDDGDLFGKSKPVLAKDKISMPKAEKAVLKKTATRDLKKTAEQIAEDPLSLLLED